MTNQEILLEQDVWMREFVEEALLAFDQAFQKELEVAAQEAAA